MLITIFACALNYVFVCLCVQVIHVMSVSSKKKTTLFYDNNIDKLRNKLYDVACHLQVASSDGLTCTYSVLQMIK